MQKFRTLSGALSIAAGTLLVACTDDNGNLEPGTFTIGVDGDTITITEVADADNSGSADGNDGGSDGGSGEPDAAPPEGEDSAVFNRVATFAVCTQLDPTCNTDTETAAEIVAASDDGNTLVYSNSPLETVGFVDITDPTSPLALGEVNLGGEPTSVAVLGSNALVSINLSEDFINVAGELLAVDIASQSILARRPIGGQPDSIAVSPDGQYVAVVLENERDEDLEATDGAPPQAPAGELLIFNTSGTLTEWTETRVALTGIADAFPTDPEPEYVDINSDNIALVTLQENNHIILVNLVDGSIVGDFSAGSVDLSNIDASEEEPAIISLTESLTSVPREPDGATWLSSEYLATADEGDLDGGSRGFTIFDTTGNVVYASGNSLDHRAVQLGHYPDGRSENRGNEPENAEFGRYGDSDYLFVASERSSLLFVYDVAEPSAPALLQVLPTAVGPEGVLAIPQRNLLIAASEVDDRGDKIRSALNIYELQSAADIAYPTIESAIVDGLPIPFAALSGLGGEGDTLYAVEDSFYGSNRVFTIDNSQRPAVITGAAAIRDDNGVLAALETTALSDTSVDNDDPSRISVFDAADLTAMINADGTVNLDPEGIDVAADGGFWIVSEGAGTVGDEDRPINSLNLLIKLDENAVIERVVTLPDDVNADQFRFGFEGVATYGNRVYVVFQRAWADADPRIGIYDTEADEWWFSFYPLDPVESQNGGWVGLSDIASVGDGTFLILERDNQGGPDAAIKRVYSVDLSGDVDFVTLEKTLVVDLLPTLAETNALTFEKVEGLALIDDSTIVVNNDNDGVDDNSGENQLLHVNLP